MLTRIVCACILVMQARVCAAHERPTAKRPASRPTTPSFIIGVFQQPTSSFDAWRGRGVNTLVGYEGESRSRNISNHDWSEAAAGKGFYYIRQPSEDLEGDARDLNLLAWMHDDEPDVKKPPTEPKILQEVYDRWKKTGPNVPAFINFSGGNLLGGKVSKEFYRDYSKAADWIGNDFYAVTGYNRPDWLWKIGASVDALRDCSGGKPQFAVIECSAQRLPWTPKSTRGVTADEFRAEVWHAVIHGVKGIVYFPQQIGPPFFYDTMPEKVAMEMSLANKRLSELADILSSEVNPAGQAVSASSPMEVGWRVSGGRLYVIALNFSDDVAKSRSIKVGSKGTLAKSLWEKRTTEIKGGEITDDYGPYEARIYEITPSK